MLILYVTVAQTMTPGMNPVFEETIMSWLTLSDGSRVRIELSTVQAARLKTACFRGMQARLAGNFFAWNCFRDFIDDAEVTSKLVPEIESLLATDGKRRDIRIELDMARDVGWDSLLELEHLTERERDQLERKNLNTKATALFVPPDVKAPMTNGVTLVVRIEEDDNGFVVLIQTIYPGWDVGRLKGDMSAKLNSAWLSWTNPGE